MSAPSQIRPTLILGPAIIPRHIRPMAGKQDTLLFDFKPRYLSGYDFTVSPPYNDTMISQVLSRWESQAAQNLPWLLPHGAEEDVEVLSVPSRELTLKILQTTSGELRHRLKESAAGLPPNGWQTSPEVVFERQRRDFAAELKGTIANFAFDSLERVQKEAYLWRAGQVDNDFAAELIRALPIDLNQLGEMLKELHRELVVAASSRRISGDWGYLQVSGTDIKVILAGDASAG